MRACSCFSDKITRQQPCGSLAAAPAKLGASRRRWTSAAGPLRGDELGKIGQHGVGGGDAVAAKALGGIERLIRLAEEAVRRDVVRRHLGRHTDAERDMSAGARRAMGDL